MRDKARLLAEAAVEEANRAVWRLAQSKTDCVGMGTTVVLGFVGTDWLAYANVGDSRLYRLREARRWSSSPMTTRSSRRWWIKASSAALTTRRHYGIGDNILTRALGSTLRCASTPG